MKRDRKYRRRLITLADKLDRIQETEPARFDYGSWVGTSWQGDPGLSCGTSACALGWATTIPSFQKLGLVLKRSKNKNFRPYVGLVQFHGAAGNSPERAALEVFGLEKREFSLIFIPRGSSYVGYKTIVGPPWEATAKQVADHIRRFVALVDQDLKQVPTPGARA